MKWLWLTGLFLLFSVPLIWNWDTDTIPVHNGFGWDGNMYGMYTQFLPEAIEQGAINTYRMQRMLIPAALYWVMKGAGLERTQEQVIQAYRLVNMFFAGLAIIAFFMLAWSAHWFNDTIWLGFAAIFFSMPFMKMSLFYPILADIPAFAIGLWAVFFWVKGWRFALLFSLLLGAFVGPTMWVYGLLLLPGSLKMAKQEEPVLNIWWALISPILFMIIWFWVWQSTPGVFFEPPSFSQSVRLNLLPFSLLIVLGYLWWVGQQVRTLPSMLRQFKTIQWLWLFPFAIVILLVQWIIYQYAGDEEVPQTALSYLHLLVQQSVTYPGGFLIAHFTYIPGIVLIGLFASPFVHRIIQQFGPGPWLLTVVTLGMALGSETRQLMQVLPWIVFLFLVVIDNYWRFNPILLVIIILGLWLAAPWWVHFATEAGNLDGQFLIEPAQRYFRYHGPWMNQNTWFTQMLSLGGVVAFLALTWRFGLIQTIGRTDSSVKKNL